MCAQVLTRHISDPISWRYKVGSNPVEPNASIFLKLETTGMDIGLHSSILNLFRISIGYFPCLMKKHPFLYQTSKPKKNASTQGPSSQTPLQGWTCSLQLVSHLLPRRDYPHIRPVWEKPHLSRSTGCGHPHFAKIPSPVDRCQSSSTMLEVHAWGRTEHAPLSTMESILNSQLHDHSEVYLSNPISGSLFLCLPIYLPLIYHFCYKYLSFSYPEIWYHVNFPLIIN